MSGRPVSEPDDFQQLLNGKISSEEYVDRIYERVGCARGERQRPQSSFVSSGPGGQMRALYGAGRRILERHRRAPRLSTHYLSELVRELERDGWRLAPIALADREADLCEEIERLETERDALREALLEIGHSGTHRFSNDWAAKIARKALEDR
jgi:hypothetical protein